MPGSNTEPAIEPQVSLPPLPPRKLADDTDHLAPQAVEDAIKFTPPLPSGLALAPDLFIKLIGEPNRGIRQDVLCASLLYGQYILIGAEAGLFVADLAQRMDKVRIVQMLSDESFFQLEVLESLGVLIAIVGSRRSRTVRVYKLDSIMHLVKYETLWKGAVPVESRRKRSNTVTTSGSLDSEKSIATTATDEDAHKHLLSSRLRDSIKSLGSRTKDSVLGASRSVAPNGMPLSTETSAAKAAAAELISSWAQDYTILDVQSNPLSFEVCKTTKREMEHVYLAVLTRHSIDLHEATRATGRLPSPLASETPQCSFELVHNYWVPLEPRNFTFVENASRFVVGFGSRCGIIDARTKSVEEVKVRGLGVDENDSGDWLGCIRIPGDAFDIVEAVTSPQEAYFIRSNSDFARSESDVTRSETESDSEDHDVHPDLRNPYRNSFDVTQSNVQKQDTAKKVSTPGIKRRSLMPNMSVSMSMSMPRVLTSFAQVMTSNVPDSASTSVTSASVGSLLRRKSRGRSVQASRYLFTNGHTSYIVISLPATERNAVPSFGDVQQDMLQPGSMYVHTNESTQTVTNMLQPSSACRIKWTRAPKKVKLIRTSRSLERYLRDGLDLNDGDDSEQSGVGLYLIAFHSDMIEWVPMEQVALAERALRQQQSLDRQRAAAAQAAISGVVEDVDIGNVPVKRHNGIVRPEQSQLSEHVAHLCDRSWQEAGDTLEAALTEGNVASFWWARKGREGYLYVIGETTDGPKKLASLATRKTTMMLQAMRDKKGNKDGIARNAKTGHMHTRVDEAYERASRESNEIPAKGGGRWRWLRAQAKAEAQREKDENKDTSKSSET